MDDTTARYIGGILEDINHKFDVILEGQAAFAPNIAKIAHIDERTG